MEVPKVVGFFELAIKKEGIYSAAHGIFTNERCSNTGTLLVKKICFERGIIK